MLLVDANKIIAFCNEWEKHFDFKNVKQVPSFLVGIWTVKEYVQSLPAIETLKAPDFCNTGSKSNGVKK